MSVTGLCTVCGNASATHVCDRCGALVCDRHWDAATGFCVECAADLGDREHAESNDRPEDTDTYRF